MSRLHQEHHRMLRDPAQITGLWSKSGVDARLLQAQPDKGWKETLDRLGVTILVTREYEHLVLALSSIQTTWLHLPRPSGLVVDRKRQVLHLACTRNPNLLMELQGEPFRPIRVRFLPGCLYLHDLALIGGHIYGNAVGQNAVIRLSYEERAKRVWWPISVGQNKRNFQRNYLQLNSIAAGKTLRDSFFSASSDHIRNRVPGDPKF